MMTNEEKTESHRKAMLKFKAVYSDYWKKWREDNPRYQETWREENPEKAYQYIHNRILFKGKTVVLDHNPRTGTCSKCGAVIDGEKVKQTHIHHTEYNDNEVLAHTVELCASCHGRESRKREKKVMSLLQ